VDVGTTAPQAGQQRLRRVRPDLAEGARPHAADRVVGPELVGVHLAAVVHVGDGHAGGVPAAPAQERVNDLGVCRTRPPEPEVEEHAVGVGVAGDEIERGPPAMERLGWGRIVNVGATSGLVRSHSVYGLAKGALLHLTESLALELAPAITVNAVVPSQIASARTDRMPTYKAAAIAATPLGRLVTEAEIGRMVALVCSPAFDFVTGRAIIMDGGRSLPVFPRLNLAAGAEP